MSRIVIIGCGDIGERVALLERADGHAVAGLSCSPASARRLHAAGIEPLTGDLDIPSSLRGLPVAGALVYYFAPPPGEGVNDPRLEAFVAALVPPALPRRVVLLSTTGVYGDCHGEWVTEDRPPQPRTDRAKRRLAAETALRRWSETRGVPGVILRVPGIYARGRLPEDRLRAGEPVLREAESPFSNRIHADDLARVCVAAARRGRPQAIYNVSDGHPSSMTDFFCRVADLLGLARPPAITLEEAHRRLDAGMLSYLAESKRIDNRRMREELGVEPMYPNLAAGLPSCFDRCG
ncbi:MAG: SDR family oxidoreductase [Sulfuricaulis sp.]